MELVVNNESIEDAAWRKLEALGYKRPTDSGDDE